MSASGLMRAVTIMSAIVCANIEFADDVDADAWLRANIV